MDGRNFTKVVCVVTVISSFGTMAIFSELFRTTHSFTNVCKGTLIGWLILYTCVNETENTCGVVQYACLHSVEPNKKVERVQLFACLNTTRNK